MNAFGKWAAKLRALTARQGFSCDSCGVEVFEYPKRRLCGDCESRLARNDTRSCPLCGRETVADGTCLDCKRLAPYFNKGCAPFTYNTLTAKLINRLKNGNRRIAYFFGEEIAKALLARVQTLQERFGGDRYALNGEKLLIIPVPLTRERRRERGYNQAEELAFVIAAELERLGVATEIDLELLTKTRETDKQKELGLKGRVENVRGAYHVHKRNACKKRTALLVDDIMTTGATGSECARVLKNAGVEVVYFAVCAALGEMK